MTGRLNKSEGADKAVLERSEALELKGHRPLLVSKHDFKLLRLKQLLSDAQVPCNVHGAGREQHLLVSRSRGARALAPCGGARCGAAVRFSAFGPFFRPR